MDKNYIKERTLDFLVEKKTASYVDIENFWEYLDYQYKGNDISGIIFTSFKKLIIWEGWREEAFSILDELIKEGKIKREVCSTLIYRSHSIQQYTKFLKPYDYHEFINIDFINDENINHDLWLPCILKIIE